MRVLVIGDAHVDEKQSLKRFDVLRNKIVQEQPSAIVIIGDFLSFNCLSDWDKDKRKKLEGTRYQLEIDAGNKALDKLMRAWPKDYKPMLVYIEGNHEDRLTRYLDVDPTFEGAVSVVKNLKLTERGFDYIKYKKVYSIKGVGFVHIPCAANGKAIGNPNVAQKALRLFATSVVFGHTHTLDHAAEHRHGAPHLNQALSVGCFFEHVEEYAQGSMTNYWRGVVDLTIYSNNRFDITTTSMHRLYKDYANATK